METKCTLCNKLCNNISDPNYTVYVHKWRDYGGYSQTQYPKYLCSQECLDYYKKNYKCNHCHIIVYDWRNYQVGPDDYIYCNDEEVTLDDDTCYNQSLINNKDSLLSTMFSR
jgi:hypothetical protein